MLDVLTRGSKKAMGRANFYGQKKIPSGPFVFLEKKLGLERYFLSGFPVRNVARFIFLLALGILYISNAHYSEETTRKISRLQIEVEDLRADYITLKADLMVSTKQSEVAKRVRPIGLKASVIPPNKIQVSDD